MKQRIVVGSLVLACASPAYASRVPDLKSVTASVDAEYLSYSDGFGSRRVVNANSSVGLGKTKLLVRVSQGKRSGDEHRFRASRFGVTVVRNWSSSLSTRTSASLASKSPVFVNRELVQEVSWKPSSQTVLTLGGRYARYHGDVDARSLSVGVAQYFRGGLVSYRFSAFDIERLGRSAGHLGSIKLNDRGGSTQLWVGHGSAIHDADWMPAPQSGQFTSAEIRRSQRLIGAVSVDLGVKRNWYEAPAAKFRGTGVQIGLRIEQ
jgi:YaiO family outer membrane protein